ncbi:cell division cycle protein 16 homolog isoform X1 [Limulus polyphemus]|uniref:Cell division cycle protein 16 homolog isoform X1 n=1 Tax=Limulus polyphemus TaxID=6850 RepID=A0ABM1BFC5_LIMPO|nr:cell division cycle protein 16 homolog isoform X1 [Limulus polyphemus]
MEGERKELNVEEIPVSSLYDRDSTVPINLNKYRKAVKKYINKHHYHTALFWADKVVSLNNGDCQDIFWLAHCLFLTEQYHRAAYCIKSQNLHKVDLGCRYLAAKCHFAGKEYQEALATLDVTEANSIGPNTRNQEPLDKSVVMGDKNWESSIQLLKGQIHEAMDNRGLAAMCFREALHLDVYCYEAFHSLIHHQMLLKEEEKALMESLPFGKQCCEEESKIVRLLYETQLKKYDKPSEMIFPPQLESLENNLDIKTAQAERCYYNCDYQQCFKITSLVLNKDSFHSGCLPIHISCLMELQKSNDLFYFAHKLVDLYPEKAIAWFAVGCYYLLINKTDAARRYLSKATTLDRVFGPAWLVYGHSFAVENEHDQAMAAYFKASQLMKGCHLPLLYIGLEYGLTHNIRLAERFFNQALEIAPEDPFVLHELGVVAFQSQDYATAEKYFRDGLDKVENSSQTVLPEKWEALLNNLGHVCRKLRKYEEALEFHQQALVLSPQNPASFAAIGYVHSLTCHWTQAVEYFHKALGLQRDDTFSTTMLKNVIEHLMNEMVPCEGIPDELPIYEFPSEQNLALLDSSPIIPTEQSDSGFEIEMEATD